MTRWSTRLLKRLWCVLLHFPYHRKYTLRERTVKICDVCDRTEDDVSSTRALVMFLMIIVTWVGLIYLAWSYLW